MTVQQTLKTLRIVLIALTLGLVSFLVLTVLLARAPEGAAETEQVFLVVLAFLVVGEVIAYIVLRRIWIGQLHARFAGRQVEEDEPLILRSFFNLSLIGAALTEGASFFGAVIYWVDGSRPALFVAGLGVLLLLLQWPTPERYRALFERITGQRSA